jgi:hypothetical protein
MRARGSHSELEREVYEPFHALFSERTMSNEKICPICGERDPYPRWFCISRASGAAVAGEPCSYSLDAMDRMTARFSESAQPDLAVSSQQYSTPGGVQ